MESCREAVLETDTAASFNMTLPAQAELQRLSLPTAAFHIALQTNIHISTLQSSSMPLVCLETSQVAHVVGRQNGQCPRAQRIVSRARFSSDSGTRM